MSKEAQPAPEIIREIQAVVKKAKQGDASVLPRLRALLAEFPILAQRYGDIAKQAEAGWAALAAGPDLYLRETLLARAAAMRDELGGPAPTPVERLLVERVVATWFQLNYFDSVESLAIDAGESPRLAQYRARRQQQAHVAHLSALAALTTLRRLMPATAVEAAAAPVRTSETGPNRNGRGGNGGRAKPDVVLPPAIQDRLAGLFGSIDTIEPATPGRKRVPVAADN